MKKTALLITAILFSWTSFSQITITNDDIVDVGNNVLMGVDSTPDASILPGNPGANQIWDFSALEINSVDTLSFVNPDWTAYNDTFPDANFAMINSFPDSTFAYFNKNDDYFKMLGIAANIEQFGFFTFFVIPGETIVDFPLNYQDTWNEEFYIQFEIDSTVSMKIKRTTNKTVIADAWGEITTPLGTYSSLRINNNKIEIDSTWTKIFGEWVFISEQIDTIRSYSWWSDNDETGYELVSMDFDEDSGTVQNINFLKAFPYSSIEEPFDNIQVKLYPNPVNSNLNIALNNDIEGNIQIIDFTGKTIRTININNKNIEIDVSNISPGIYFYRILDNQTNKILSGKFLKN